MEGLTALVVMSVCAIAAYVPTVDFPVRSTEVFRIICQGLMMVIVMSMDCSEHKHEDTLTVTVEQE